MFPSVYLFIYANFFPPNLSTIFFSSNIDLIVRLSCCIFIIICYLSIRFCQVNKNDLKIEFRHLIFRFHYADGIKRCDHQKGALSWNWTFDCNHWQRQVWRGYRYEIYRKHVTFLYYYITQNNLHRPQFAYSYVVTVDIYDLFQSECNAFAYIFCFNDYILFLLFIIILFMFCLGDNNYVIHLYICKINETPFSKDITFNSFNSFQGNFSFSAC